MCRKVASSMLLPEIFIVWGLTLTGEPPDGKHQYGREGAIASATGPPGAGTPTGGANDGPADTDGVGWAPPTGGMIFLMSSVSSPSRSLRTPTSMRHIRLVRSAQTLPSAGSASQYSRARPMAAISRNHFLTRPG